jgi:hypothetical protein
MAQRIINAETEEPIDPQIGYVDGYTAAERLLEGVLFEITIDPATNLATCLGVREEDKDYCKKFSAEQMQEWCTDCLYAADDSMCDESGEIDLTIEEYVL